MVVKGTVPDGNTTLGLEGTTVAILGVNIGLGRLPKLLLPAK